MLRLLAWVFAALIPTNLPLDDTDPMPDTPSDRLPASHQQPPVDDCPPPIDGIPTSFTVHIEGRP